MGHLVGGEESLEEDLQSELGVEGLAWAYGWIAEKWSDRFSDRPTIACSWKSDWLEIGVVEEIVHVGFELNLHSFCDSGCFDGSKVEVLVAGVVVLPTTSWRVSSWIWVDECRGVEPLNVCAAARLPYDGMGDAGHGVFDDLNCAVCIVPVAADVLGSSNGERRTSVEGESGSELPTVCESFGSMECWYVVVEVSGESVTNVEIRVAVLCFFVEWVLREIG